MLLMSSIVQVREGGGGGEGLRQGRRVLQPGPDVPLSARDLLEHHGRIQVSLGGGGCGAASELLLQEVT